MLGAKIDSLRLEGLGGEEARTCLVPCTHALETALLSCVLYSLGEQAVRVV